jgi:hypothetical protein
MTPKNQRHLRLIHSPQPSKIETGITIDAGYVGIKPPLPAELAARFMTQSVEFFEINPRDITVQKVQPDSSDKTSAYTEFSYDITSPKDVGIVSVLAIRLEMFALGAGIESDVELVPRLLESGQTLFPRKL